MNKKNRVSKQSWIGLIFLWLLFAMNANGRELTNRVLPGIIQSYGISANTAGLIGTVSAIAMCLASLPLSRWADKGGRGWHRKKRMAVLTLGFLVFMLLNGLSPLTGTFSMVLIWQFMRGMFSGPAEACGVGIVAEWWPKEKNGLAMGLHHTGYPWGTALGGLLVTAFLAIAGIENWRYTFILFPVLGFIVFFFFWKWCNKNNYIKFQEDTVEAGMTPPIGREEATSNTELQAAGNIIKTLKNPNILFTAIACLLSQFAYIGFMFWLTPYLTYCAGYSATAASGLSVVYAISGGLGQIFWGNFSDKHGAKKTLAICCAWLACSFFLMKFISISIIVLVALQLLLGCCSNAVYPVMYKMVADSSDEGTSVTGNGILTTFMFCGAAVATSLMGFLIEAGGGWSSMSGYMTGLMVMGGAQLVAFLLITIFTKEPKKKISN